MKTNISYSITVNPYKLTVYVDGKTLQSFVMPNELGSTLSALALTGLKRILRNSYADRASEAPKLVTDKIEKIRSGVPFIQVKPDKSKDKKLAAIDNMLATLDPKSDADMIARLHEEREAHLVSIAGDVADSDHVFMLGD